MTAHTYTHTLITQNTDMEEVGVWVSLQSLEETGMQKETISAMLR